MNCVFYVAVFVLDPWFAGPERVGVNRYRFLLESLQVRAHRPCERQWQCDSRNRHWNHFRFTLCWIFGLRAGPGFVAAETSLSPSCGQGQASGGIPSPFCRMANHSHSVFIHPVAYSVARAVVYHVRDSAAHVGRRLSTIRSLTLDDGTTNCGTLLVIAVWRFSPLSVTLSGIRACSSNILMATCPRATRCDTWNRALLVRDVPC